MPLIERYISDRVDDPADLLVVNAKIAQLGFDTINEIPKPFSLYQMTEGFDVYDELRQNLDIPVTIDGKELLVNFVFRSIREENDEGFTLIEIEAKTYTIQDDTREQVSEKHFSARRGFPSKAEMVREATKELTHLARDSSIKPGCMALLEKLNGMSVGTGRRFKP